MRCEYHWKLAKAVNFAKIKDCECYLESWAQRQKNHRIPNKVTKTQVKRAYHGYKEEKSWKIPKKTAKSKVRELIVGIGEKKS